VEGLALRNRGNLKFNLKGAKSNKARALADKRTQRLNQRLSVLLQKDVFILSETCQEKTNPSTKGGNQMSLKPTKPMSD